MTLRRLPHLLDVPLFLRASAERAHASSPRSHAEGYEVFDAPFRDRLRVVHSVPGDAELSSRLTLVGRVAPALVHWEVARDARFREIERYGLFFAHAQLDYQVRVALRGLSPGIAYWARLWAGGSWSPTVRVHTESYAVRRPQRPVLHEVVSLHSAKPRSVPALRAWATAAADP